MTLSTLKRGRGGVMVEAAPLVPDRTFCNSINDFELGGVALIDTSLRVVCVRYVEPAAAKIL